MNCGLATANRREVTRIVKARRKTTVFARAEVAGVSGPAATINLAGKLAAKKAVLEALDLSGRLSLTAVRIVQGPSGKPGVVINHPSLRRRTSGYRISLSISHTKNTAVACCLIYDKNDAAFPATRRSA